MNQRTIAHILASAAVGLSTSALAAEPQTGQIRIEGKVIATTCAVDATSQDMTVTLPAVDASSLTAPASSAAPTRFTINISSCELVSDSPSIVSVAFVPDGNVDASGNLRNLAGSGPQGVAVQILDNGQNPVNINTDTISAQQARGASTDMQGRPIALHYYAQYYSALGSAAAGAVSAIANFRLVYE